MALMTVIEIALKEDISPESVYRAIRLERLKAFKIDGKFVIQEEDLRSWLAAKEARRKA